MKRILTLILLCGAVLSASAQAVEEYQPTSTWPYIYSDFMDGTLHQSTGGDMEGKFNIHLLESRLHFIEGNLVKEASPADVYSVKIGQDIFVNAGGTMMRVLAKSDNGIVAQLTEIDVTRLNETGGAYGSSSNSMATTALSSIENVGGIGARVNHMEMKNSKNEGKILPVITKLYIVTGNKVIFATKKDVSEASDKEAFKSFQKEHKIKWRDPQSLLQVVDFLAGTGSHDGQSATSRTK